MSENIREVDGVRFIHDGRDVWHSVRGSVRVHSLREGTRYTVCNPVDPTDPSPMTDSFTLFHTFVFAARRAMQESKRS